MAVGEETSRIELLNVVAGTEYTVNMKLFEAADLSVYYGNPAQKAVLGADYTIELRPEQFDTFGITFDADFVDALVANRVVLLREMDYKTDTTPASTRFMSFTSREFDRAAMRDAQLQEAIDRTLRIDPTGGAAPSVQATPSTLIGLDGSGAWTNYPLSTLGQGVVVTGFDSGVTDDRATKAYPLSGDPVVNKNVFVFLGNVIQTPNTHYNIIEDPTGLSPVGKAVQFLGHVGVGEDYLFFWQTPVQTNAATDGDMITLGDGRTILQAIDQLAALETRADFVTWIAEGNTAPDGYVKFADDLAWQAKAGATDIADMPGWVPFIDVCIDHFGTNTTPGTTDMTSAINDMIAYQKKVNVRSRGKGTLYLISDTITFLDTEGFTGVRPKIDNEYADTIAAAGLKGTWFVLKPGVFMTANKFIVEVATLNAAGGFARQPSEFLDFGVWGNRTDDWDYTTRDANNINTYGHGFGGRGVSWVRSRVLAFRCGGQGILFATGLFTFDASTVDTANNRILLPQGHTFKVGQKAFYDNDGGGTIGGLTTDTVYYIAETGDDYVSLSATPGGAVVSLTSSGTGTQSLEVHGENRGGCNNIRGDMYARQCAQGGVYLYAGDSYVREIDAGACGGDGVVVGSCVVGQIKTWNHMGVGVLQDKYALLQYVQTYDNDHAGWQLSSSCIYWYANVEAQDNGRNAPTEKDKAGAYVGSTNPGTLHLVAYQKNATGDPGDQYQKYGFYSDVACDVVADSWVIGPHTLGAGAVDIQLTHADAVLRDVSSNDLDYTKFKRHGFTLDGTLRADNEVIELLRGLSFDTWGTSTLAGGVLTVTGDNSLVGLPATAGDVTGFSVGNTGATLLFVRNTQATARRFVHSDTGLRLLGGKDVVLEENEAMAFVFVSGSIWQQVAGKIGDATETAQTIETTGTTILDASIDGAMWDVRIAHPGGRSFTKACIGGDVATPLIVDDTNVGPDPITLSVSGTDIVATSGAAYNLTGCAVRIERKV